MWSHASFTLFVAMAPHNNRFVIKWMPRNTYRFMHYENGYCRLATKPVTLREFYMQPTMKLRFMTFLFSRLVVNSEQGRSAMRVKR
jgi:hypothetical protein